MKAKELIQDTIQKREETDTRMSGAWILIVIIGPLIPFIVSMIVFVVIGPSLFIPTTPTTPPEDMSDMFQGVLYSLLVSVIGIIIGMCLIAFLVYKLIERRNEHFKRSRTLREGLIKFLNEKKEATKGKGTKIASLRSIHSNLNATEDTKSAALYAFLTVIFPPVLLYVMYFLTRDFVEHGKKERVFFRNFTEVADDFGMTMVYPEWKEIPNRAAGLYVALSFVTGFFVIYWLWTLLKDPHQHFEGHQIFEDHLSNAFS